MDKELKIISDINEKRLDLFISLKVDSLSRSYIQDLIAAGNILVNGKIAKSSYKIKENDVVDITIPEPELLNIEPENININIVYEDEKLLIINKEKGMVVHPAAGHYSGTLVNAIMYHCKGRLSSINGIIRPGIVHRIDMDTSGLLIVAKDNESHLEIARQLKEHSINRIYEAIVYGRIKEDNGLIDIPIGRDINDRKKMSTRSKSGKDALTKFTVLERFNNATYIRLKLATGRTHQIRVHMAHLGFPLVGDNVYGRKNDIYKKFGQVLHAKTIGFIHPQINEYLEFNSDLPKYFKELLNKFRC